MFNIETLLILIPALPLSACLLTAILGPRVLRERSHVPTVVAIIGSFLCSLLLVFLVHQQQSQHPDTEHASAGFELVFPVWTWFHVEDAYNQEASSISESSESRHFTIDVSLRADALTAVMLAMVTFVSSLVAIYSIGYMHGERGYWRFFCYVSLFVFSMTMLVSVSNFLLLYVFWEAVGACSYLLIGFWYQKPEASAAGKKAFLVNRIGDFGFALALFLIWTSYGTLNYHDTDNQGKPVTAIFHQGAEVQTAVATHGVLSPTRINSHQFVSGIAGIAICLLLLVGACGKSAQFPLHVWLPDAMEGPTPVSALIHAATMVTAGVYMVTRCTPLFMVSPDAQVVVAVIGGVTALIAGLIALTQTDLKRVLAYSTISQLGYMFLGLGTATLAGITAGMFHLFTHAFFKALLFLGAGSVMHAMGGIIDMRHFGGLRRLMPVTHITFVCGCLALAGVFPFAGFWSKDAIVASVHGKMHDHHPGHAEDISKSHPESIQLTSIESKAPYEHEEIVGNPLIHQKIYTLLYYMALFTAFLTAFYTFRALFMTFYGQEKIPHEAGHHAHESPANMWIPLAILAVCAIGIGAYFELTHSFAHFLGHTPSLAYGAVSETVAPGVFHFDIAALSTIIALLGVGLAAYFYLGPEKEIAWLSALLKLKWLEILADRKWSRWLRDLSAVKSVRSAAQAVGLGTVATVLGYMLLVIISILSAPLLIGYYLSPYNLSQQKFYFDEIYNLLIVHPLKIFASICYWVDRNVVDGLVNFCGWVPQVIGSVIRSFQTGLVQFYALAMVLGVLLLVAVRIIL